MEHIDAETLWLKLKARGVAISRASVYNLMQILVQKGFAERYKSEHDRCSSFKAIKI